MRVCKTKKNPAVLCNIQIKAKLLHASERKCVCVLCVCVCVCACVCGVCVCVYVCVDSIIRSNSAAIRPTVNVN